MIALYLGLVLPLLAAGAFTLRVSEWHSAEGDYWHGIHLRVLADPAQDAIYRPVLMWAKAHRPPPWRRALGWKSPEQRMEEAVDA